MRRCLILLVRSYQYSIGLILPRACRFEPSCSNYAVKALETHVLWRAMLLIVWRIFRCNPLSPGGYDPVPAEGKDLKGGDLER